MQKNINDSRFIITVLQVIVILIILLFGYNIFRSIILWDIDWTTLDYVLKMCCQIFLLHCLKKVSKVVNYADRMYEKSR